MTISFNDSIKTNNIIMLDNIPPVGILFLC